MRVGDPKRRGFISAVAVRNERNQMATTEKLMELLRRAHTVIGEGLIENALDELAEGLHNEIAEVLGIPVTLVSKSTTGSLSVRSACRIRIEGKGAGHGNGNKSTWPQDSEVALMKK
jgi:3-oxoacyl-(acyl-carrier-protein) synthase